MTPLLDVVSYFISIVVAVDIVLTFVSLLSTLSFLSFLYFPHCPYFVSLLSTVIHDVKVIVHFDQALNRAISIQRSRYVGQGGRLAKSYTLVTELRRPVAWWEG